MNRRYTYTHTKVDYGLGRKTTATTTQARKWLVMGLIAMTGSIMLKMSLTHPDNAPTLVQDMNHELQALSAQPVFEFPSSTEEAMVTIATQTLVDTAAAPIATPEIEQPLAHMGEMALAMIEPPAAILPVVTPPPAPIPDERLISVNIKRGDTVAKIFENQGFDTSLLHEMMDSEAVSHSLTKIHPGQALDFTINPADDLLRLEYNVNELERLVIDVNEGKPEAKLIEREIEELLTFANATIDDSLFMAGAREGIDQNITMELARIFGWDIDFALDIRKGDSFSVIYEDRWVDGERITPGNVIAAEFINQGKTYRAIRYETADGLADYYTPEGHSMRKAFIRTPVELARVSSKFNPHRRHPVLHTIRAHKGVDYAAATGTPVRATSDGIVTAANTQNGYGKVIEIQHGQNYSTLYAHLNGFASKIKKGAAVKQGQVIGYVGMTGMATGPHLHYEFRVNGVPKDPLTVELPNSEPIHAKHKPQFLAHVSDVLEQLSNYQNVELAQAPNPSIPAKQGA